MPSAAKALPELNPNQPTHNSAAPVTTKGRLCGACIRSGKPWRLPTTSAYQRGHPRTGYAHGAARDAQRPMQRDTHFSQVYAALRAKGHRHGQALRTLGDRLLRILMAMLRERICYDVSRIRCEPVVQMR